MSDRADPHNLLRTPVIRPDARWAISEDIEARELCAVIGGLDAVCVLLLEPRILEADACAVGELAKEVAIGPARSLEQIGRIAAFGDVARLDPRGVACHPEPPRGRE